MSSLVEGIEWEHTFALDGSTPFPWQDFVHHIAPHVPLPVYDLYSIVDAAAAYDIAWHAFYYDGSYPQAMVHIPHHLSMCLSSIKLNAVKQQQYFARALYSECSRYTIGVPKVKPPPVLHMSFIPAVPRELLLQLKKTLMYPKGLHLWLYDVILHASERHFKCYQKALPNSQSYSGRRKRKHCAAHGSETHENVYQAVHAVLEQIHNLSPRYAPSFSCVVQSEQASVISVTLSACQSRDMLEA